LHTRLSDSLCIPTDATVDSLSAEFCLHGACDEAALRQAAEALSDGSKTDRDRGAALARWCAHPDDRISLIEEYVLVYLTKDGGIRDSLITNAAAAKVPAVPPALCAE